MGAEAPCRLAFAGQKVTGKALLESEELLFRPKERGDPRVVVPLRAITSISAAGGVLKVVWDGQTAGFEVGEVASKWLDKIKNPKSRADKLGIKPGFRIALVGGDDAELEAEIVARGAEVTSRGPSDIIFCFAETRAALAKLVPLQKNLKKDGAIWVIRPKGAKAITEKDVLDSARAAGLVDVKVAAFSPTHTAEKLVIPINRR